MTKIAIARDADGRISAADKAPRGRTLRDYEAEWFPRKVEFVDELNDAQWADFRHPLDREEERTAAIKALLDERDELRKAALIAEFSRLRDCERSLRAEAARIAQGIRDNAKDTVWIGPAETACDALDRMAIIDAEMAKEQGQ